MVRIKTHIKGTPLPRSPWVRAAAIKLEPTGRRAQWSWIQSLERQWAVISGQQEMFSPALCSYCPPQPREHSCKMKTPWVIFPSQWMRAAPMTACKREIASWKKKIFQRSACCAQLNCDDPLSLTVLFFWGGVLFVCCFMGSSAWRDGLYGEGESQWWIGLYLGEEAQMSYTFYPQSADSESFEDYCLLWKCAIWKKQEFYKFQQVLGSIQHLGHGPRDRHRTSWAGAVIHFLPG